MIYGKLLTQCKFFDDESGPAYKQRNDHQKYIFKQNLTDSIRFFGKMDAYSMILFLSMITDII